MKAAIRNITGRGLPLPGNDIDTDQIIESRYLKLVSFRDIEVHLFESARRQALASGHDPHPLDDPRFMGAKVLIVNRNFGCGSSREHAPQAIRRFGIRAIVGESFGEIFSGNCLAIGLPCVSVKTEDIAWLQQNASDYPDHEIELDLMASSLTTGGRSISFDLSEGRRRRFLDGSWDTLEDLIRHQDRVNANLLAQTEV